MAFSLSFNKYELFFWILLMQSAIAPPFFAQDPPDYEKKADVNRIRYETLILPSPSPDSLDYHFYVQIAHNQLQFVLDSANIYRAGYEITAALLTKNRKIISSQIRLGSAISPRKSDNGITPSFEMEYFHFRMPKNQFIFYIELFDRETRRSIETEKEYSPLSIPPVWMSDIFFIQFAAGDTLTPSKLRPMYPASRSETDSVFKAMVYIAARSHTPTVSIHRSLTASDNRSLVNDTNQVCLESSIQPLMIHLPDHLDFGSYRLRLELLDSTLTQIRERTFFVQWGQSKSWIPELKLAIESLSHVLDGSTIEEVLSRPRKEQEKWLQEFWEERNPMENSETNPLQKEYYQRVMTANRQFSAPGANRAGWRTDRGYVFIIYGPPTDVDRPRSGFGQTERYEIWYYRNLQKRFVFVEQFGSGDYRLVQQE